VTKLCNNLGQVVHTCVPVSRSSLTWYWLKYCDVLRLGRWLQTWRKVTASDSCLMCDYARVINIRIITIITPGSALGLTLTNKCGRTLTFYTMCVGRRYAELDRVLKEKDQFVTNLRQTSQERETQLQSEISSLTDRLEQCAVTKRQLEWTIQDLHKDKSTIVERLYQSHSTVFNRVGRLGHPSPDPTPLGAYSTSTPCRWRCLEAFGVSVAYAPHSKNPGHFPVIERLYQSYSLSWPTWLFSIECHEDWIVSRSILLLCDSV